MDAKQPTPQEYDKMLKLLPPKHSYSVPREDFTLFGIFETVSPKILFGNHWLVRSNPGCFRLIIDSLGTENGAIGPAPPDDECTFDEEITAEADFYNWNNSNSQSWLAENIENLKYSDHFALVCSREIPRPALEALISAAGYGDSPQPVSFGQWLNLIQEYIEAAGWFYIILPEYTNYDLLVVSEKYRLKMADAVLSVSCAPQRATWREGRAFWPKEPAAEDIAD